MLDELARLRVEEPVDGAQPFRWAWASDMAYALTRRESEKDGFYITLAELESMRRAIRTLARQGFVEAARRYEMGSERRQLACRLPLSVEEGGPLRARQRLEAERLIALGCEPMGVVALLDELPG